MMDVTAASGTILNILQFIGTTAFAISGALVAGRRKMDLVWRYSPGCDGGWAPLIIQRDDLELDFGEKCCQKAKYRLDSEPLLLFSKFGFALGGVSDEQLSSSVSSRSFHGYCRGLYRHCGCDVCH
jgi:hypothetical protein